MIQVVKHKTKSIKIKRIEVDEKIIPLVKWINKFNGTMTDYSCQGSKNQGTYISFHCWNSLSLFYIMKYIGPYTFYINVDNGMTGYSDTRFILTFTDSKQLQTCIKKLPKIPIEEYEGNT